MESAIRIVCGHCGHPLCCEDNPNDPNEKMIGLCPRCFENYVLQQKGLHYNQLLDEIQKIREMGLVNWVPIGTALPIPGHLVLITDCQYIYFMKLGIFPAYPESEKVKVIKWDDEEEVFDLNQYPYWAELPQMPIKRF